MSEDTPASPMPDSPTPENGSASSDDSNDRNMAMLAHILAIFLGFIGPLIIWLLKKDESKFVDEHGKESLNFQITLIIAWAAVGVISFITMGIGCLLVPVVSVFSLVFCIIAAVAASKGEPYKYPVSIRLVS